jgi:hypothetical protein
VRSNAYIYQNANASPNDRILRILEVEELDDAALQLRKEFLASQDMLAIGRVRNPDNTVKMVIAKNGDGALGTNLRALVEKSQDWERVPRMGFGSIHAEERLIAKYGNKLEAIGVAHRDGICLVCAADMKRRGIGLASPVNRKYDISNVSHTAPQGGLLDVSWGWIGEDLPNPFQR